MTLFELQAWLGHRTPSTTQHYAKISPNTLSKAYTEAGYFARNIRTIEVLVDRAGGDGVAVDEDLDGADVAGEVTRLGVGLGQGVRADLLWWSRILPFHPLCGQRLRVLFERHYVA